MQPEFYILIVGIAQHSREIFCCPILFSLWRVRRSWLRNIVRRCSSISIQREIFKRLGNIVYSIFSGVNGLIALEELIQDFVDQSAFIEYFKASWVPKLGKISLPAYII